MIREALNKWLSSQVDLTSEACGNFPAFDVNKIPSVYFRELRKSVSANPHRLEMIALAVFLRDSSLAMMQPKMEWWEAELGFWRGLCKGTNYPWLGLSIANCFDRLGDMDSALESLSMMLVDQPHLAFYIEDVNTGRFRSHGGHAWLEFRIEWLRGTLSVEGELDDSVRENYSELLEDYSDDPRALRRVKALGPSIDKAVMEGRLPRAFVRRSVS